MISKTNSASKVNRSIKYVTRKLNETPKITENKTMIPYSKIKFKLIDWFVDPKILKRLEERNEKVISFDEGKQLCSSIGANKFVECSAITQNNLSFLFKEAINCVLEGEKISKKKKSKNCNILWKQINIQSLFIVKLCI